MTDTPHVLQSIFKLLRIDEHAVLRVEDDEKILGMLYQILTILDSKAAALLQFNGVVLAACSVLLAVGFEEGRIPKSLTEMLPARDAMYLVMMISLAGCLLSFTVVRVSWSFLKLDHGLDWEFAKLARMCGRRQLAYRAAWFLSVASTAILLAMLSTAFIYPRIM